MLIKILKKIRIYYIIFKNYRFLKVGKKFSCGRGTIFYAKNRITLNNNVYIGRYCNIECDCEIGNDVLIANNVGFIGRNDHDFREVGVPIRFALSIRDKGYTVVDGKIIIGDDVWIGYGATILSGVRVGEGAIISACALVLDDVSSFTIVAGQPAKAIGVRFNDDEIILHKNKCRQKYSSYQDQ